MPGEIRTPPWKKTEMFLAAVVDAEPQRYASGQASKPQHR
jgi:hypothetical protein